MKPERIAELRALAEAAKPAPWMIDDEHPADGIKIECTCVYWDGSIGTTRLADVESYYDSDWAVFNKKDADFIVAARTALPEALDEIERLRGVLAKACLGGCAGSCQFSPCAGEWITKEIEDEFNAECAARHERVETALTSMIPSLLPARCETCGAVLVRFESGPIAGRATPLSSLQCPNGHHPHPYRRDY